MRAVKQTRLRMTLAWVIGIASAFFLMKCSMLLLDSTGVSGDINYLHPVMDIDGGESEGTLTEAGAAIMILAVMLGVQVGKIVYSGKLNGGATLKENVNFFSWVFGIAFLGVMGGLLRKSAHYDHIAYEPWWWEVILDPVLLFAGYTIAKRLLRAALE